MPPVPRRHSRDSSSRSRTTPTARSRRRGPTASRRNCRRRAGPTSRTRRSWSSIGEVQSNGYIAAQQQNYGPHFQAINARLRALGLRTYTPAEIRAQIAQAEIDAYFRNDPDAALSASKRLGANFVLRGLISAQATRNPMMNVNQVSVNMEFTLYGSDGRLISTVEASENSYAGADVAKMALTLVNEKADEVVPALYADYCTRAAPASARKPAPK